MGVVRIDDKLQKEILDWIKEDDNKYQYPSVSSFINSAIHEKLKTIKGNKNERKG